MADDNTQTQTTGAASVDQPDQGPSSVLPSTQPSTQQPWTQRPTAWQWTRLDALREGTRKPKDDQQAKALDALREAERHLSECRDAARDAFQHAQQASWDEDQAKQDYYVELDAVLEGEQEQDQAQADSPPEPEAKQPDAAAAQA